MNNIPTRNNYLLNVTYQKKKKKKKIPAKY